MRVVCGLFFLGLLSACATGTGGGTTAGVDQVTAATTAWGTAFDSRDPARITAMYAPDAVLWGTSAKVIAANPSAIAEYFKDSPNRPNLRVEYGEQHARVYGDIGVNSGYYTFSDVRDGKKVSVPARFTLVFRNVEGKWLIVAHHSSRIP